VDNESGVLNKCVGLLSARGFNIESLTVSPTNLASLSRMTVVIRDVSDEKANQASQKSLIVSGDSGPIAFIHVADQCEKAIEVQQPHRYLQCLGLHPIKPFTWIEDLMLAALIHGVKSATKQRTDRVTVPRRQHPYDLSQLLRH
jgi:hypothetical protein